MTLIIQKEYKAAIKFDWDLIRIGWRVQTTIKKIGEPLAQDNKLSQILTEADKAFKAIGERGLASIQDERKFINLKDNLEGIVNE